MNNFEYIKELMQYSSEKSELGQTNKKKDELANFLCNAMEDLQQEDRDWCDTCPVRKLCSAGWNGWREWLIKEKE